MRSRETAGWAPRRVSASLGEGARPWNQGVPGCVGLNEDLRDSQIRILVWGLIQVGKKGLEPGSVGACRVELDSGGKRSRLMEALKAFSLAFSGLSCKISLSSSIRCS